MDATDPLEDHFWGLALEGVNRNIAANSNHGSWIGSLRNIPGPDEFSKDVDNDLIAEREFMTNESSSIVGSYLQNTYVNNTAASQASTASYSGPVELPSPVTHFRKQDYEPFIVSPYTHQDASQSTSFEGKLPMVDEQEVLRFNLEIDQAQLSTPHLEDFDYSNTTDSYCSSTTPTSVKNHICFDSDFQGSFPSPSTDAEYLQMQSIPQESDQNVGSASTWQVDNILEWVSDDPRLRLQLQCPNPDNMPSPHSSKMLVSRSATSAGSSFTCPQCDKEYLRKSDLHHHARYHKRGSHTCEICKRNFHFTKDLKRHAAIHSSTSRVYLCSKLGCEYHVKGFKRQDHLRRHMKTVHPQGSVMSRSISAPQMS